MYKITNAAFKESFKKFNVTRLEQLSIDQLKEVAKEAHEELVWSKDTNGRRISIQRTDSINFLKDQYRLSDYMPESYWSDEQRNLLNESGWNKELQKAVDGKATYQFFQNFQLGYSELRPSESIEVDYTPAYMKEVFMELPAVRTGLIEIYDDNGKQLLPENKSEIGEIPKILTLEDELAELKRIDLYKRAAKYTPKLKPTMSREHYIDIIMKVESHGDIGSRIKEQGL